MKSNGTRYDELPGELAIRMLQKALESFSLHSFSPTIAQKLQGCFFKSLNWEHDGKAKAQASTFPSNFHGSDSAQGN